MRVRGTKNVINALKKLSAETQKKIRIAVADGAASIEEKAKMRAAVDQGYLRASIDHEVLQGGFTAKVFAGALYAAFREFGTKSKTVVPPEMADLAAQWKNFKGGTWKDFEDNIRAWAHRKGIPEDAVWPIMMKIYREGTTPHPFMYPALVELRPVFIKEMIDILKQAKL